MWFAATVMRSKSWKSLLGGLVVCVAKTFVVPASAENSATVGTNSASRIEI